MEKVFRFGNLVAHDAFGIPYEDVHILKDVGKGLGTAHHHGLSIGLFEGFRHEAGSLEIEFHFRTEQASRAIV
jgi:hypothetical protein